MGKEVKSKGFMKVIIIGELRKGFCEDCGTKTEKEFYYEGTDLKWWALDDDGEPVKEAPLSVLEVLKELGDERVKKLRKRVRVVCPNCRGMGQLVVKTYSVQPPPAPKCTSGRCLRQFVRDVKFCDALARYHNKRVEYATRNRDRIIAEKYRTGEPSPTTIKQCLWWIMKLNLVKLLRR